MPVARRTPITSIPPRRRWPRSNRPANLTPSRDLFDRWDYSYVYDEPLERSRRRAKRQYESTDRAVVALWRMHYLQAGQLLRGFEQFFVDLLADRDLAHALFGRLHRAYMRGSRLSSTPSATGSTPSS